MFRFFARLSLLVQKTIQHFERIEGNIRSAAFAYFAFLALFPLLLFLLSLSTLFVSVEQADEYLLNWLREIKIISEGQQTGLIETIRAVLASHRQASVIALIILAYLAQSIFQSLVRGINAAWRFPATPWWHLPVKNLLMLLIVAAPLFAGLLTPVVTAAVDQVLAQLNLTVDFGPLRRVAPVIRALAPTLILAYAVLMIYKLAPSETVYFRNIWPATLVVTVMLQLYQLLFLWFIDNFGRFNVIYGALSTIAILMVWLFMSGNILFLGGCLCAAHAHVFGPPKKAAQ